MREFANTRLSLHKIILFSLLMLYFAGTVSIQQATGAQYPNSSTIVIDNEDPEYSEQGNWAASGLKGYNNSYTRYGYSNTPATASWNPLLQAGLYRVSIYKIVHSTSATNAKIDVHYAGGTNTQYLNHRAGSSGWVELGTFPFEDGNAGNVLYTWQGGALDGNFARTDAVKFERVGDLPKDTIPPTAQLIQPIDLESAQIGGIIQLSFSENMEPASVNASSIRLFETSSGTVVDCVYQFHGNNFQLIPVSPLTYSKTYTVAIGSNVTDLSGNPIDGIKEWNFTTERKQPQTVIIDNGDPGYSESGTWQDSTSVRGYNNTSTRFGTSNGANAEWTPSLEAGTYRVSIFKLVNANSDNNSQIDVSHAFGTSTTFLDYTTGNPGWVDLGVFYFAEGNGGNVHITPMSGSFARADAVRFEQVFGSPTAQIRAPVLSNEVNINTSFTVEFSKNMTTELLTTEWILLRNHSNQSLVPIQIKVLETGRALEVSPLTSLAFGASYTLELSHDLVDTEGMLLDGTTSWTFTTAIASNPIKEFFVSPDGDDHNPGTAEAPFATIGKAQSFIRTINSNMEGDITVYLSGGIYQQSDTLRFTAQDSGTNGYYIAYRNKDNEQPVISGGTRITGWTQVNGSEVWKASAGNMSFRQLYVNGKRADRAKSDDLYSAISFNADKSGFIVSDQVIGNWQNANQIELSWYKGWRHSRAVVDRILPGPQPGTNEIVMKQPYFNWILTSGYTAHGPNLYGFQIENARELLDKPGEWYLDPVAQEVYYWPLPGEEPVSSEIIAPQIEKLIDIQGTLEQPVEYLKFNGITFRYGTWMRPSEKGISTIQGDIIAGGANQQGSRNQGEKVSGNIWIHAANHIRFERNRVEHMGAAGIVLEYGTSDVTITGNIFTDISAAAVIVGDLQDAYPPDNRQVTRRNLISNNVIYNAAAEYWGSTGIFGLYVEELNILHNELYDLPYSAISVGWGWNAHTQSNTMKNNKIEGNHIHHYMYKLRDGGGVYTLGKQPGTTIERNLIHDQIHVYGGIYLDAGSSYITVKENMTYHVPKDFHGVNDVTNDISNNYFGLKPDDAQFPTNLAENAGLQPAYRDLLAGLPEPTAKPEETGEGTVPERSDNAVLINGGPGYSETGEWTDSNITGYDGISPTRYTVSGEASATWRPNLYAGWYQVSFFTMIFSNSDPNAKVDVYSADGSTTTYVNQTVGEMGWVDLGIHYFAEGTEGYVQLTRMTAPPANNYGYARANAVRFKKLPAPADATFSANITSPTNTDVMVTIHYPDKAVTKEYKMGENGIWAAYTAPVLVAENDTVYVRGIDSSGIMSNITSYTVSNIDKTAPVIRWIGEATYSVTEAVYLSCTATDDLSGLLANPCTNAQVDGVPAYGLGVGTHTATAQATDLAGNQASSTGTFTITLSFNDLRELTRRFVTESDAAGLNGVINSLIAKIDNAEKQADKHKDNKFNAYIHELSAIRGNKIAPDKADILIALSGLL
ncbi:Ig-like domain-containing protein [Paenibacillus sp. MBLB4367]|uniref:golvesin C-terminal-like domain-containing protein n=1 Tax=Paenibacillus sp. MBLB4367 TaxID=3384767 RepID=UPI00390837B0